MFIQVMSAGGLQAIFPWLLLSEGKFVEDHACNTPLVPHARGNASQSFQKPELLRDAELLVTNNNSDGCSSFSLPAKFTNLT